MDDYDDEYDEDDHDMDDGATADDDEASMAGFDADAEVPAGLKVDTLRIACPLGREHSACGAALQCCLVLPHALPLLMRLTPRCSVGCLQCRTPGGYLRCKCR